MNQEPKKCVFCESTDSSVEEIKRIGHKGTLPCCFECKTNLEELDNIAEVDHWANFGDN